MVLSLILAMAFCNFSDRSRRNGLAGFPQHLFVLPANTRFTLTCVMAFAVVSVVGIYVVWVKVVFEPVGIDLLIQWPAAIIAAGVVFYQATIWCLSGFRLTRVFVLSVLVSTLVGVGLLPAVSIDTGGQSIEGRLTAGLAGSVVLAYGIAVITVGVQRRGGARGVEFAGTLIDWLTSAIPHKAMRVQSASSALYWMEWRRSGAVLPAAVLLTLTLILGPIMSITGRGPDETLTAAVWLAALPMLLALPIGKGLAKPDFWSLDLAMPPFLAVRPIDGVQLIVAKLRAAAASALLAWALLLAVAPLWMYATCDLDHMRVAWEQFGLVYAPHARWAIPILLVAAAVLLTWTLLVGSIWIGYRGRPVRFYVFTAAGAAAALLAIMFVFWWLDHRTNRGSLVVLLLPWLPWVLATLFTTKMWLAAAAIWQARRYRLVSDRILVGYFGCWAIATMLLILLAWQLSPRIGWLRGILILTMLLVIPLARIVMAAMSIANNRHR
jgi:hypothetical protein